MSHDRPQMSHDRPQMSHDRPQTSHDRPQMSHDRPQMGWPGDEFGTTAGWNRADRGINLAAPGGLPDAFLSIFENRRKSMKSHFWADLEPPRSLGGLKWLKMASKPPKRNLHHMASILTGTCTLWSSWCARDDFRQSQSRRTPQEAPGSLRRSAEAA